MKLTTSVKLQPWQTPNYVLAKMPPRPRQEGFIELPKWHVRELDADVLSNLCDQFRAEIFRKAGISDPRTV